jgi:metal-responsive CopG/Arc/MetJ family transcriptional regulator
MAPRREGKPITVRLPDDVIGQIDTRRARTGQSRAESLRKMILWALAQPEVKR